MVKEVHRVFGLYWMDERELFGKERQAIFEPRPEISGFRTYNVTTKEGFFNLHPLWVSTRLGGLFRINHELNKWIDAESPNFPKNRKINKSVNP